MAGWRSAGRPRDQIKIAETGDERRPPDNQTAFERLISTVANLCSTVETEASLDPLKHAPHLAEFPAAWIKILNVTE